MGRREKWKDAVVGSYDWRFLCMPTVPWEETRPVTPYFGKGWRHHRSATFDSQHWVYTGRSGFSFVDRLSVFHFRPNRTGQDPIYKTLIGSGLLSVTCISLVCLSLEGNCLTAEQAYGKVLGTVLLVCWYHVAVSICPPRILTRVFPPIVTGTYLILPGASLIAAGFQQWGGGTYCANQVLMGLLVGTAGAAISHYTGCSNGECQSQRYVTGALVKEAKWVTFLWSHIFRLGFYAPALLPTLFAFIVITMECIGDVIATTEANRPEPA